MNTLQMLVALEKSSNKLCSERAKAILNEEMTIEEALALNPGSFMTAVLKGDYEKALETADGSNRHALLTSELPDVMKEIFKPYIK